VKRLALALILAVAACQTGGDPGPPVMYGPSPFQVWTPPPAQPAATQTYFMPGGRMMSCTTYGTVTSCF
jgi:hypothetical protein